MLLQISNWIRKFILVLIRITHLSTILNRFGNVVGRNNRLNFLEYFSLIDIMKDLSTAQVKGLSSGSMLPLQASIYTHFRNPCQPCFQTSSFQFHNLCICKSDMLPFLVAIINKLSCFMLIRTVLTQLLLSAVYPFPIPSELQSQS